MSAKDDCIGEAPDLRRRKLLTQATAAAGGLTLAGASAPFLASLAPSERARSTAAPLDADLGGIAEVGVDGAI